MRVAHRIGWGFLGVVLASTPLVTAQEKKEKRAEGSRAELEKKFQEELSGSVLTGYFSIVDKDGKERPNKEEKYTISSLTKLEGDLWLFSARVQYGQNDVTVPMPLEVKWAGDTPVITLTDLTIPGLGTFTARVVIYRGRYAGTWQHGEVGGHLWGTVSKVPAEPAKEK